MNLEIRALSLVALGSIALWQTVPARAQQSAPSQDLQIYAGYLFGDRLTEAPLSADRPRLNDNATFGARYTYHWTDTWGLQLSAGYSPGRAGHVASGDTNLGLTTVDLEWDMLSTLDLSGHELVPYAVLGAGYAWADLDYAMFGVVSRAPIRITDSNGYSANAGLGLKYYVTDKVFVGLDGRYRYMSRLVSNYGLGSNTTEATMSIGYRF